MSNVTKAIITWPTLVPGESTRILEEVNKFFQAKNQQGFVSVEDASLPDGWYGGTKYLECFIGIGAFNYLDDQALVEHIREIDFSFLEYEDEKRSIQLILREQEARQFKFITIFGKYDAGFNCKANYNMTRGCSPLIPCKLCVV